MAAKYSLHVALAEPLVRYVAERVAAGEYATASEVVRTGLRLLIEQDPAKDQGEAGPAPPGPQTSVRTRRNAQ
jgi:antitoxin ParD1/3/4